MTPSTRKNMDETEIEDESNFRPRPYQDQMLEIVLKKNTIIYLPTGAGKTFIALMAMRHLAKDLDRSISKGGRRTVFLVNTVVLAQQQAECIRKATSLKTSVYTGYMNVDAWRRDKWLEEFEDNQVLVATCQIILDVIRHGYITVKNLNLIIFDECHHGRRDHPMHQLMTHYNLIREIDRPRIIGLTGMLIGGSVTPKTVVPELEAIENTFHSTIATARNFQEFSNVLLFSTNPQESIIKYDVRDLVPILKDIFGRIKKFIETLERWPVDATHLKNNHYKLKGEGGLPNPVKSLKTILNDFLYQMEDMGVYGASIAILSVLVEFELKKRSCDTNIMRLLLRELITGTLQIRHILVEHIDDDQPDTDTILTNSSPKIIQLFCFLQHYFQRNNSSELKALIFVKRRYTAKCLYHVIKKFADLDSDRFPIRADFMVGNNSHIPESIEAVLENKWNRRVIERFKKNEINTIVASSVLEEGIDLQMCNLVISYDQPETFRSYIQSKGRARMVDSCYVIMVPTDKQISLYTKLNQYKQIDKILKEYLIGKSIDRPAPLEEEIDKEFANQMIKPFKTSIGAVLEALSAIQLLNRYCMTLPVDKFTISSVLWSKEKVQKGIVVKVTLPIQSTVRCDIYSDVMPNLKMAKRSAAFKACIALYENGELNDNLMPINNKRCMSNVSDIYFKLWENYPDDTDRIAGTKKNYRIHEIIYPELLSSCSPTIGKKCYLYLITMLPRFEFNNADAGIEVFHTLFQSINNVGILTSKILPHVGSMSLYLTFGKIECKINAKPIEYILNDTESLENLRNFHIMIFRDILGTWKEFFVYDYANLENSYFIVPTVGNEINWKIVKEFDHLSPCQEKTEQERKYETFRPEDYLYKVICPWYRKDVDSRYIVTKVHEHLSPNSAFPNDTIDTYANYYDEKYKMTVVNMNQSLIEVKGITSHLNRLIPGQSDGGAKNVAFRGPEILIPELCHNFMYPGDLWLKLTLLPSILHRLQYLLHAEKIRIEINKYVGIEVNNYMPEPVIENMILRPNVDNKELVPAKSIIIPNPDIVAPKKLETSDFVSLSCTSAFPWTEMEEPIDLNRHVDDVFSFEIDYFYNFVNNEMGKLQIDKKKTLPISNLQLSICDSAINDKIELLNIKLNTPTQGILQSDLLAAITTSSSADVFDMERLEVIGDAFLKFGVSLHLMQTFPSWHEGFLTTCKGKMVSNRNLCYNAFNRNIPGIIKIFNFNPKNDWMPPMLTVPRNIQQYIKELKLSAHSLYKLDLTKDEITTGTLKTDTVHNFVSQLQEGASERQESSMQNFLSTQWVSDKMVADCVEAIIGACVKSIGIERSFLVLEMFNILPEKINNNYINMLNQKMNNPRLKTNITDADIDSFLINYRTFEKNLGYEFKDRAYLLQALTHPSFPTNQITGCYQQLEFLGDAILDFLVTSFIFENCPRLDPGGLTDLRSALVNNVTLGCICVRKKLHLHILSQNAVLSEKISSFVDFQQKHNNVVTEQVLLLVEETDLNMGEYIDVPKTLGDIVEAVIAAVFLDSGNNLQKTWGVIYGLLKNEIKQFSTNVPKQIVRQLYEFPGANPKFDEPIVEVDFVMIILRFTRKGEILQVQGVGQNKEEAKRAAAKVAMVKLLQ